MSDRPGPSSAGATSSPQSEPELDMVTNANRTAFVHDYVDWLVHRSVEDEFDAFAKGFFTCLDKKALGVSGLSPIPDNNAANGNFHQHAS